MSNFKLLAIRPVKGCNKRFVKNLVPGQIYPLFHSYSFYSKDGDLIEKGAEEVFSIKETISFPQDIFNRMTADGFPLNINISAIAGKNGTGKSSLIELFFACVYLYSVSNKILSPNIDSLKEYKLNLENEELLLSSQHKRLIKNRNIIIKKLSDTKNKLTVKEFNEVKLKFHALLKKEDEYERRRATLKSEKRNNILKEHDIIKFSRDLKAEVFFELDNHFYKLLLDYENDLARPIASINIIRKFDQLEEVDAPVIPNPTDLSKIFFYTIAVNYSHYALNSNVLGDWIKSLFHKNDGYKTPIVISPMRTEGNFDINSEINFARYRLLANKLQEFSKISKEKNKVYVTENHFINKVIFRLNRSKVNKLPKKVNFRKKTITGQEREVSLLQEFFSDNSTLDQVSLYSVDFPLKNIIVNYIINKIDTIPKKYPWFGNGYQYGGPNLENNDFFKLLREDASHITYKLKQAVNFLRCNVINRDEKFLIKEGQLENNTNIRFEMSLDEVLNWMDFPLGRDIMGKLPPSIFDIDFELSNEAGITCFFNDLSSGEQQLIHVVQSVIYHLNNIQSAYSGSGDRVKYKAVNIIYDEIELYFHPDYQRRFISDLLKEFERFHLGGREGVKSINIVLLTHSPFILSDLPSENILLLELDKKNKKAIPKMAGTQTFAANINDLLADGFFLTSTLMGQFSENEIKKAIARIKENAENRDDNDLLDHVGDSFLRASLQNFKKRYNG